jgi:mediator of RNA polymerase II transcription subunit 13
MCTELKLYTPPYIISPVQETKIVAIGEPPSQERSNVLLCGYCLSQDQRWLLAVCTDSKGELMETCNINIEIPNRNRRKKASARRIGLGKLWDFILATVTRTTMPWRLVIGRFGRIGHGELKGKGFERVTRMVLLVNRIIWYPW